MKKKLTVGKLYGAYSHPWGIKYTRSNIKIRKKTIFKLPIFKNLEKNYKKYKVLEIGGTGQDAVVWSEFGFNTTYVDLSKENIKKTQKYKKKYNLNLKTIYGDFHKIKLKKNYYDIVRSRGVIHHMESPDKVLKKINYCLKKNGYFHFNLYRSGIFYYFFVELLRNISSKINIENFYQNLLRFKISNKENLKIGNYTIKAKSDFYTIILDDLFVPILNPANYFQIKKDLINLNFKIIKENKIKKYFDHSLLYPDFPLKKEHIVFDVIKLNDCSKNIKIKYKISKTEAKLANKFSYINRTINLFNSLIKIAKFKRIYNQDFFIKLVIYLYKELYLISVTNMSASNKHKKFQSLINFLLNKIKNK